LSLLASLALMAGSHDTALLYFGRLLAGVSSGAAFGAGTAWVRELSRPPFGASTDHSAAKRAAVAMAMGFALGPLTAGLLGQWAPHPMIVAYLPHLLLMVGVLWSLRSTPETVALTAPPLRRPSANANRARFLAVVAPVAPWVFAGPSVAFALLPSVVGADRARDGIGLDAAVAAICALSGVLVQPLARRLDAHPDGNRAATVGLAVTAIGVVLGALAAQVKYLWLLLPCAVVLGLAYGLCMVAGLIEVQRLAQPDQLARLTAVYYVLTYVGFAVPSVLVLASHVASYSVLLLVLSGLAVATALALRPLAARSTRPRLPATP
jgi:MFS family permease